MKKQKIFIWIFIAALIVLVAAAMTYQSYVASEREKNNPENKVSNTPEVTPTPENGEESISHCLAEPASGTGMITIESPSPIDEVLSPFEVKGTANVFEGSFVIKLKLCDGRTIVDTFSQASGEIGENNPYSTSVFFDSQYRDLEAYIEAYSLSAKDGSMENLIQIPIRLK